MVHLTCSVTMLVVIVLWTDFFHGQQHGISIMNMVMILSCLCNIIPLTLLKAMGGSLSPWIRYAIICMHGTMLMVIVSWIDFLQRLQEGISKIEGNHNILLFMQHDSISFVWAYWWQIVLMGQTRFIVHARHVTRLLVIVPWMDFSSKEQQKWR